MRKRILIVDDSELNRCLLGNMLSDDYDLLEANDGQEALTVLQEASPKIDAVLLDLMMPVMDGYEVLRIMRQDTEFYKIPVIVITGANEYSEAKALALGANDFLVKPYQPEILKQRLSNILRLCEASSTIVTMGYEKDPLTNLLNKNPFLVKAAEMIAQAVPGYYVLACFDINNFKVINDRYGYAKGDSTLRHVAQMAFRRFSVCGGICCRLSDDNFAVLYAKKFMIPGKSEEIQAIMGYMGETIPPLTFSIGRYNVTDKKMQVSAMLDRAILAMERARDSYSNNVVDYDESMRERNLQKQEILNEMELALEEEQFKVWFQPQYNHASGALIGAEALVRWQHPVKGLIFPNDFIPVFEQNGFIYELDKYVWEQSCKYLHKWLGEWATVLPVSVNVSRVDLLQGDFIKVITEMVRKYNIPVKKLRLEITESAFTEATQDLIAVVKQLRDFGFIIEIDDFGSGYSSLNILKNVPAHTLKLDMRFLEDDGHMERGGNILESVVRMARWLSMPVIAEGVETKAQADYLKTIGCYYIQGYYYAKPMPVEEYEALSQKSGKESGMIQLETVENLDNSEFWKPSSMDTLIFNSYVGGACIFEYHNGATEILRVNDKFRQELFGDQEQPVEDIMVIRLEQYMKPAELDKISNNILNAIATGQESVCEFKHKGYAAKGKYIYIRCAVRVIAKAGEHYLIYASVLNVTAQRKAELQTQALADRLQIIMDNVNGGVSAIILQPNGQMRYLFYNKFYCDLYGYTEEQLKNDPPATLQALVHPDDVANLLRVANTAAKTGDTFETEYRILKANTGEYLWVRVHGSCCKLTGIDGMVHLTVSDDISAEKEAERKLNETTKQIRFLNLVAGETLSSANAEDSIPVLLNRVMDYFAAERAHIFEFDETKHNFSRTYYVGKEIEYSKENGAGSAPKEWAQHWIESFSKQGYISFTVAESINNSCPEEYRQYLFRKGITSLIAVPLIYKGQILGFSCLDNPQKNTEHVKNLQVIGNYLAGVLIRRNLNSKIREDNELLKSLMNDTPGAFCRMQIDLGDEITGKIIYFNDSYCRMMGRTAEDVWSNKNNITWNNHPDDLPKTKQAFREMLASGETRTLKYRLLHKNGSYLWFMVFARITKTEQGVIYLNAYYTHLSEQARLDEQSKELLEHLPCGAGIFELDGDAVKARYINQRYFELVGRSAEGLAERTLLDMVHPDDRVVLIKNLQTACRNHLDSTCDLRIKYADTNEYVRFHCVGKIMQVANDQLSFYGTFTPVSEEEASFSEMIRYALSAMMASSTELSFVKDKNLAYVCCSHAFAKMVGLRNEKDIIGKTDYDLFTSALAEKYVSDDKRVFASGQSIVDEIERLPSEDGLPRYSSTSKYLLKDAFGNIVGLYGRGKDVTEERVARSRLELLNDSVPGGLASYSCSNDDIKLVYFNDGMCKLLGLKREEYARIAAKNPFSLAYAEDYPIIKKQFMTLLAENTPIDCTYRIHMVGGGYKWLNLRGVPFEKEEGSAVVNAVLYDVTAQKQAEQRQREEKESLLQRMQMFKMIAAHSNRRIYRYDFDTKNLSEYSSQRGEQDYIAVYANIPDSMFEQNMIFNESIDDCKQIFSDMRAGKNDGKAKLHIKFFAGPPMWVALRYSLVDGSDGQAKSAIISTVDITEDYEKELAYHRYMRNVEDDTVAEKAVFFDTDLTADVVEKIGGSIAYAHFPEVGCKHDEAVLAGIDSLCAGEYRKEIWAFFSREHLMTSFADGNYSHNLEWPTEPINGRVMWVRANIQMIQDPYTKHVRVYTVLSDITESKQAELNMRLQAVSDGMTKVYNRGESEKLIRKLLGSDDMRDCVMIIADVDDLKTINDTVGHPEGDRAIKTVASVLKSHFKRDKDIVGRIGGDEFIVFLDDTKNLQIVQKMLTEILAEVKSTRIGPDNNYAFCISMGVATGKAGKDTFESLYRRADIALYSAKNNGKQAFAFYNPALGK